MKYDVEIRILKTYRVDEIQAKSEKEAIQKAWRKFGANSSEYYDGEVSEVEAFEI